MADVSLAARNWDQPLVALTVDVEWAHPDVLADVVGRLDERGLQATFFCTHAGIAVPGHQRALHPNFRRQHNSLLDDPAVAQAAAGDEMDFYGAVAGACRRFCPEAVGVRSHGLFYDSRLLKVYARLGLEYDSSYFLPLTERLQPTWKGAGVLELPIYYMDFWHLNERVGAIGVDLLQLDTPGLKVLTFHPNLIYLNASTIEQYDASRAHYHDVGWLEAHRSADGGIRDLFLRLLDMLAEQRYPTATLEAINARCRPEAD